jgi:cytochrome c oxidase subunit 1
MRSGQNAAYDFASENRLTVAYLIVAHVALFLGVLLGFLQALEYAGINLYPHVAVVIKSYYHGLSLHGVLNVLVRGRRFSSAAFSASSPCERWERHCKVWPWAGSPFCS